MYVNIGPHWFFPPWLCWWWACQLWWKASMSRLGCEWYYAVKLCQVPRLTRYYDKIIVGSHNSKCECQYWSTLIFSPWHCWCCSCQLWWKASMSRMGCEWYSAAKLCQVLRPTRYCQKIIVGSLKSKYERQIWTFQLFFPCLCWWWACQLWWKASMSRLGCERYSAAKLCQVPRLTRY